MKVSKQVFKYSDLPTDFSMKNRYIVFCGKDSVLEIKTNNKGNIKSKKVYKYEK